jgi:hypothetical protein
MDPFILRCIERILVVCFSGITVYLGYRLFSLIPGKTNTEGKVILPGGISIYMSRVGPGAFFALFGMIVLALSLYFPVEIKTVSTLPEADKVPLTEETRRGMIQHPETQNDTLKQNIIDMRRDMYKLNNLTGLLKNDLAEEDREDLKQFIKRVKLRMIQDIWVKEWGDFEQFKEWTRYPAEFQDEQKDAVELYNHGVKKE